MELTSGKETAQKMRKELNSKTERMYIPKIAQSLHQKFPLTRAKDAQKAQLDNRNIASLAEFLVKIDGFFSLI